MLSHDGKPSDIVSCFCLSLTVISVNRDNIPPTLYISQG